MDHATFSSSLSALVSQLQLQTRLFHNALSGISDKDAIRQINTNTNHVTWLTGHLVSSRFFLANVLGIRAQEPFPELFAERKGILPHAEYPGQQDLMKDWDMISDLLISKLQSITPERLNEKIPFPVPTGDTLESLIAFIAHHEAYTIGQIGLYRRYFGYAGMEYP